MPAKLRCLAQQVRRAQQHGGVAVVAAGVHLAGVAAGVGQAGGFGKGQGIHVGPQAHAGAGVRGAKTLAVDAGDQAGGAQPLVYGQPQRVQVGGHLAGGALFLVAQFRVAVQIAAQLHQGGQVGGEGGRHHKKIRAVSKETIMGANQATTRQGQMRSKCTPYEIQYFSPVVLGASFCG